MEKGIHELLGGYAYVSIEHGSSIMLKVATPDGDPVEMQWADARALAQLLLKLADEGEALESSHPP